MKFSSTVIALGALNSVWALPTEYPEDSCDATPEPECPSVSGDILINQYQLYPENLFYDSSSCKLILGALYNASVYIYDLATSTSQTITFPNITLDPKLHISGVRISPVTSLLSVIIDAGAAFDTQGSDISGSNFLIQYDLSTSTETSRLNLTETTQGLYGGYQDLEFDSRGNIYVVGTYPSSILKVDPSGEEKVEVWYLPNAGALDHTVKGLGGLAVVGDVLLANDNVSGELLRFDLTAPSGSPTVVPHNALGNLTINDQGDGIHLPQKYNGRVLLIAQNTVGLSVLRSGDGWETAEFLGVIPMPASVGNGVVTAAVQIGESVYANIEYFFDTPVAPPNSAGNRTVFPLIDVTAALDALLV
ncbi:TRI14-like protein [Cadophora sp. MPI-SDFR-AT-0126]|nr:TRI14-like protein [Leotiomycetes sp. MPI-SDFR-AT-0126]